MREDDLRRVMLVRSVEEADRTGALIPAADRAAAAREARRAHPGQVDAEVLLPSRAQPLFEGLAARHPFIRRVFALTRFPGWIGAAAIAAGLLAGGALSALDGTRRINILGPGFAGVLAWNLLVYAWLAWRTVPRRRRRGESWLARIATGAVTSQLARLIARSREFNAQLAEALSRFAGDWSAASRPLLAAHALAAFHAAAAALGIGLIAGLYLRGMTLEYQAGWASTFLEPAHVHAILSVIYAPASWVTGLAIPDAAHLEAIRWRPDGGGGENAARWIHLMAATVALAVVVPRLLLAGACHARALHLDARATLPPGYETYHRIAFGEAGGDIGRGVALVLPYAYEPDGSALACLRELVPKALGPQLAIDAHATIPYGEEERTVARLADGGGAVADAVLLLFSLASTPEDENHGHFIAGARDWIARARPQAQFVVLVDEGPYAARVGGEGAVKARLAERRLAWEEFVAARGVACCIVDLREASEDAARAMRRALERRA